MREVLELTKELHEEMKRLSTLLTALFVCSIVLAQHPHSRGGNPFYWAIVGGISAILIYAFYWGVPFVLTLFKRHRKNRRDKGIVMKQVKETTAMGSFTIDTHDKNEKVILQSDNMTKINTCENLLPKEFSHFRTKRQKIIFGVICLIMCLLAVLVVELHINNKRDRLFSNMLEQVRNSFNSDDDYSPNAEALFSENIDDLEYTEIAIPPFPNEADKHKKKHWMNMFKGVEHLYKITDGGWTMTGDIYYPVPYEDGIYRNGVQEYRYIPYMICVPKGVDFNLDIAKSIVSKALDKVYSEPTELNAVYKARSRTNEYYELIGHFYKDSLLEKGGIPFYNKSTGTEPIIDNGQFTGYYWFGMQTIDQYRVLMAYRNIMVWTVVEKGGFSASVKDRIIFYGTAFALILFIIVLYLNRDRIILKSKRMFLVEKSDEQMHCKHCGKLIDAYSDYCKYCGKKL